MCSLLGKTLSLTSLSAFLTTITVFNVLESLEDRPQGPSEGWHMQIT